MTSAHSGSRLQLFATLFCGAASVAMLVFLWMPLLPVIDGQDTGARAYGIVPLMWTMVALAVAAIGLLLGWRLPGQPAAQTAVATLLVAICVVFWSSVPIDHQPQTTGELALLIAGSLLPPMMFGWLLGYGCRTRDALQHPHES